MVFRDVMPRTFMHTHTPMFEKNPDASLPAKWSQATQCQDTPTTHRTYHYPEFDYCQEEL